VARLNFPILAISFALYLACVPTAMAETLTAQQAASLYNEVTTYGIYRKGKRIGKHSLKIIQSGDNINVSVESKIRVTVLKVPVFNLHYIADEVWQGNSLLSVTARTKTNKQIEIAELVNSANKSELKNNTDQTTTDLIKYATNHWNISATEQQVLFNTVRGTASNVNVENRGEEKLTIGEQSILATHYVYSGDIQAESWYDTDKRWVKLAFNGTDGSRITYVRDE